MSARYMSSYLLKKSKGSNGKIMGVRIVDQTSAWWRPSEYPAKSVKDDFAEVALKNAHKFEDAVTDIAMK